MTVIGRLPDPTVATATPALDAAATALAVLLHVGALVAMVWLPGTSETSVEVLEVSLIAASPAAEGAPPEAP
ncbi:MAG: hypothetical protein H7841_02540, partial [Magnetospirillum sp. WYHS-4]